MGRWGFTDSEWVTMTSELEEILVEAARRRGTVTYGEIARRVFGGRVLARSSAVMTLVDDACDELDAGRDTVTASLVVRADTGLPGEGYFQWAEREGCDSSDRKAFWQAQAERVWEFWATDTPREAQAREAPGSARSDRRERHRHPER